MDQACVSQLKGQCCPFSLVSSGKPFQGDLEYTKIDSAFPNNAWDVQYVEELSLSVPFQVDDMPGENVSDQNHSLIVYFMAHLLGKV